VAQIAYTHRKGVGARLGWKRGAFCAYIHCLCSTLPPHVYGEVAGHYRFGILNIYYLIGEQEYLEGPMTCLRRRSRAVTQEVCNMLVGQCRAQAPVKLQRSTDRREAERLPACQQVRQSPTKTLVGSVATAPVQTAFLMHILVYFRSFPMAKSHLEHSFFNFLRTKTPCPKTPIVNKCS
jgi:hypothetical protein